MGRAARFAPEGSDSNLWRSTNARRTLAEKTLVKMPVGAAKYLFTATGIRSSNSTFSQPGQEAVGALNGSDYGVSLLHQRPDVGCAQLRG